MDELRESRRLLLESRQAHEAADTSLRTPFLDGVLYMLGIGRHDIEENANRAGTGPSRATPQAPGRTPSPLRMSDLVTRASFRWTDLKVLIASSSRIPVIVPHSTPSPTASLTKASSVATRALAQSIGRSALPPAAATRFAAAVPWSQARPRIPWRQRIRR